MRSPTIAIAVSLSLGLAVAGADATAQTADPADGWDIVSGVTLEEVGGEQDWRVEKTFPEGFETGAEAFAISGWAVIYEAQAEVGEILLVPSAEDCPFCGGTGETYGPTLEVVFADPIGIEAPEERITVEGRLVAVTDTDTFQAFRLVDARLLAGADG